MSMSGWSRWCAGGRVAAGAAETHARGGQVSRGAAFRNRRRLSWDEGRRPVPPARGPGFAGDAGAGSRPRIERPSASWNRSPSRAAIKRRLTELWDFEKFAPPIREGGRYFFTYNTGLQNQSVLYTSASLDGEATRRDRPQYAFGRRHGRARGHQDQPRRAICCLRDRRGRLGLERVEGARPGFGKGLARPAQVDQVLASRVGPRRPGLLLRAVP